MMRKKLIYIIIFSPMMAAAQDMSVNGAIVDACFDSTMLGSIDPDCIGIASNLCQGAPAGSTTLGISQCTMAETAEWDRILNREYAATRDAYADTPGLADSLLAAQRAWIALRDADCSVAYDRYGGGSMRSIAGVYCRLNHTARRALELKIMREY